MHNLRCLNLFFAAVLLAGAITSNAGSLIDVAFTGGPLTSKTGFAATGVTTNDFWNSCQLTPPFNVSGALSELKFVDGTASGAGVAFINVGGSYVNGASDPMYGVYLYQYDANTTVTVTNLSAGLYDFYLYGHGNDDSQNSVFQLTVGALNYGSEATINGSGWLSSVWQEGVQYVEFTNVSVSAGQTITILVEPGASQYNPLSGLQMACLSRQVPFIVTQPVSQVVMQGLSATFSVVAGGTAPLTYQWLFNTANITAATNSSCIVTNVNLLDSGSYTVLVSNAFGTTLSSSAVLSVLPASLTTQSPDQSLYYASLMASITPYTNGTTFWFQWGIDTNYGQLTPPIILQGTNALSFSNLITGLSPYTTYHCQAVASNVFGTVLGGDVSFTTVPKFVQVGTNTDWSALALSGDGRELAATRGGIIYVSTNLGAQFTPTTVTGSVFATSSDGSTILAVSGTNIYASVDRGSTWTSNGAPTSFSCFAASPDARNLVASDGSFYVYISTNFGATWRQSIIPKAPTHGLAISADGSKIYGVGAAGRGGSYLYSSSDFGHTWATPFTSIYGTYLGCVACSADGTQVTADGQVGAAVIMSTNSGASFSLNYNAPQYASSVAMSADGRTQILAAERERCIAVSPDAGSTWYSANAPRTYDDGAVARSSADGNTLAALISGSIYIAQPSLTGALQVDLTPAGAVAAGAQWQLDSAAFETSGTIVNGLAIGNHSVSFTTIPGWTTPSSLTVSVFSNETNVITGTYIQQTGSLQVNLTPAGAVAAGAQWQVDGGASQTNGATVAGLVVGNHTVTFTPANGWTAPSNLVVSITNNLTNLLTASYLPDDALQVYLTPPGVVSAGAA